VRERADRIGVQSGLDIYSWLGPCVTVSSDLYGRSFAMPPMHARIHSFM